MAEINHTGTVTLETARLILRKVRIDDAQAMYSNYASDDEVTRYLTWPTHQTPDISRMVLTDWVSSYTKNDFYLWAITLKETGDQMIGSISVVRHNDNIRKAEIGYCIGRAWWHQGIMTEALQAVMKHLFDTVGYNRIEAAHDPNNPNSGKVMMKCGMKYEGTLRQSDRNNQGLCDVRIYALLAQER